MDESSLSTDSESYEEGDTITFEGTVYNLGNTDVSGANVSFYVDGAKEDETTVSVTAGESTTVQFTVTAEAGDIELTLKADPLDAISETDETNNEATLDLSVTDLTAPSYDGISTSPDPITEGDTVSIYIVATDNVGVDKVEATWLSQTHELTLHSPTGWFYADLQCHHCRGQHG